MSCESAPKKLENRKKSPFCVPMRVRVAGLGGVVLRSAHRGDCQTIIGLIRELADYEKCLHLALVRHDSNHVRVKSSH